MKNFLNTVIYAIAILSTVMGTLAMFAAKIASYEGGTFLFRSETHWFYDSITAFLLSISLVALMSLGRNKNS